MLYIRVCPIFHYTLRSYVHNQANQSTHLHIYHIWIQQYVVYIHIYQYHYHKIYEAFLFQYNHIL